VSRVTRVDLWVGNLLARAVNEIRFRSGATGRHRSLGLSTSQWVRESQASRGGR
jgi:hypothetical protein